MLTQDYQPRRFEDIRGQTLPVSVMRQVAKAPEDKPRVYLFHGAYGTGKTTLARIFARALNCERFDTEPCGECPACDAPLDYSPYYHAYDCGRVGAVEDIRVLKDDLVLDSSLAKYRVVVFDEFHLASKPAQSALLTVLEELCGNTFVIFCTTDLERILDTVQSRSVDLYFDLVPPEEVQVALDRVAGAEGLVLPDRIRKTILGVAAGHVRDALKLLELWRIVGDKAFVQEVIPVDDMLLGLLASIRCGDQERFERFLSRVLHTLLVRVRDGYYGVLEGLLKGMVGVGDPDSTMVKVAKMWGPDTLKLFKLSMAPWAVESFRSDLTVQAFFWSLWHIFHGTPASSAGLEGAEVGDDK